MRGRVGDVLDASGVTERLRRRVVPDRLGEDVEAWISSSSRRRSRIRRSMGVGVGGSVWGARTIEVCFLVAVACEFVCVNSIRH